MKWIHTSVSVPIPEKVKVTVKSRIVSVEGPRGKLTRSFKGNAFDMFIKDGKVFVELWFGKRLDIASVRSVASHIRNMMTGVTKGYEYTMRFVYAHFPHNVIITDAGKAVEIRNFLGEKVVRRVEMLPGVTVVRSDDVKDQIVLSGIDVAAVSQSAAQINVATLVKNKDIRKFLDGAFIEHRQTITKDL
jgi:large subunit ribosomal protein L9e